MKYINVGMVIVLILVLSCPIVSSTSEHSENLKTFVSIFNGFYTDKAQLKNEGQDIRLHDEHDLISAMWRPGFSDLFPGKWVIYLEQVVNTVINRMTLLVLSEDQFGVITAQPYKVIPPGDYKPNQYEYADLSNLTLESKTKDPFCQTMFVRLENNVYVGTYPDCNSEEYLLSSRYGFTITCNAFSALVCSQATKETFGRLPYIFYKKRSYDLPSEMMPNVTEICTSN